MDPATIGALLREIAVYFDLDGDRHRAMAYDRAASSIEAANGLHRLIDEGRLEELPGIGPSIAKVVGGLVGVVPGTIGPVGPGLPGGTGCEIGGTGGMSSCGGPGLSVGGRGLSVGGVVGVECRFALCVALPAAEPSAEPAPASLRTPPPGCMPASPCALPTPASPRAGAASAVSTASWRSE